MAVSTTKDVSNPSKGLARPRRRARWAAVCVSAAASIALASGVATAGAQARLASAKMANPYHLIHPGTLTVGMDLVFKPEMYLNAAGKPAGYDVVLLDQLAKSMHVRLKIVNLDFTGLIPGLEAGKFDMVSVGLAPTPAREKAVSFSRAYVPYALILAVPVNSKIPAALSAWNSPKVTLTALEGSTDAQLAQKEFPKAHLETFSTDTAALLQVATHRADGAVVEDYLLAEFSKSNPSELKEEPFKKPLEVQYGSYAVRKGNTALVAYLNAWICKEQKSGFLAAAYKSTEGVSNFPPMPPCP
jgi:ABC-type amino acid transport substrate-binding protein